MMFKRRLLALLLVTSTVAFAGYAVAQKSPPRPPPAKKSTDAPPPKAAGSAKPGAPGTTSAPAGSSGHDVVAQESNIEFDERMVKGQTAAGAIYLFQRSPSEFKSIVTVPETFRPRTTELLSSRRLAP